MLADETRAMSDDNSQRRQGHSKEWMVSSILYIHNRTEASFLSEKNRVEIIACQSFGATLPLDYLGAGGRLARMACRVSRRSSCLTSALKSSIAFRISY
jgi:hypothetical protein